MLRDQFSVEFQSPLPPFHVGRMALTAMLSTLTFVDSAAAALDSWLWIYFAESPVARFERICQSARLSESEPLKTAVCGVLSVSERSCSMLSVKNVGCTIKAKRRTGPVTV